MTAGVLVVLLGIGAGVAAGVGDALGIRSEPSDVPAENPGVAAESPFVLPPAFTDVAGIDSPRLRLAADELQDAVASVGTAGAANLSVVHGDDATSESYTLTGTADDLVIDAAGEAGAARGLYDLALAARSGRDVTADLGTTVDSRLGFRMVDLGAVGVAADPAEWESGDDYSHNSKAFADVILQDAPYIDEAALATARTEFEAYVRHALAEGYNAIAIPGWIEYLGFDLVEDGHAVYDASDVHVARAEAMQAAFGPLWKYAHDMGMKVYFRTDMLALTSPLERYLTDRFGGLDTESPEFWDVYAAGLDETYAEMPYIDGVLIRIGEAGTVYDLPGWDYYSDLAVTSVPAVRAMLTAFTQEAERADREVIFRTWSVGVGGVGDMHTDSDSYAAVLDGIDSDKLIVSTKYTLGDFYSHLPLNVTLEQGDHRRIVEFQSRREFENFGAFPNDLGDLYRTALQRFIAANPHVEGIWTWTQDGGPWRAGPMTLELKQGFWQLFELNTELAVRLARDPEADPAQITADWARRWFSHDPATVQAIGEAMADSRTAITDGLYIGPFADRRTFAIGLEPPPMMWVFEWDILTGDSAVLDVIYAVSRDHLDEAIAGGARAVDAVQRMREQVAGTDAGTWLDPAMRQEFLASLDYEESTLSMLSSYRAMVLRQAQWHDTLDPAAYAAWQGARDEFTTEAAAHTAAYGSDVEHPAYNLTAAKLGVDRADRDLAMAWVARALLALLTVGVVLALLPATRSSRVARALRALGASALRPWRAGEAVRDLTRSERGLLVGIPVAVVALGEAVYTWFAAPAHLVVTLGAWLVFAAVLAIAAFGRSAWPVVAAVGGAATLRATLLLAALSVTGPGGYWFAFWTDPTRRTLYITVAFALFGWMLAAAFWSLAGIIGRARATGWLVIAVGAVIGAVSGLIAGVGLESALTVWNDQMGLLPWGLSRILGIATYLDIPADTAVVAAIAGVVLVVLGALVLGVAALVRRPWAKRSAAPAPTGRPHPVEEAL